ncbi:VOC family protein [Microtetraspora malaysiensis]|uniref:VOC family protein n=1 Tax=Microtetraspora malaysiensis TaxID=161358 RepID=UPI003D946783
MTGSLGVPSSSRGGIAACHHYERDTARWTSPGNYCATGFGGPRPTLILSPSSEPRTGKLRLHIDVNATDRDQGAELERLLALGARPADVGQTGTESWHVLADPEGNEFCLLHARLRPL